MMADPRNPAPGSDIVGLIKVSTDRWLPISRVRHEDGEQVQLWAEGARVSAWSWSSDRRRWERDGADGIHWTEGDEYGPTHFCPLNEPPRFLPVVRSHPVLQTAAE